MTELTEFEQNILRYIDSYESISCVKLANEFGKGTYEIHMQNSAGKDLNVMKAFGLSKELTDALCNLVARGDLVEIPCSYMVYLLDGAAAIYPIAKNIPAKGYKETHWVPTVYDTYKKGIPKLMKIAAGLSGYAAVEVIQARHKATYGTY